MSVLVSSGMCFRIQLGVSVNRAFAQQSVNSGELFAILNLSGAGVMTFSKV